MYSEFEPTNSILTTSGHVKMVLYTGTCVTGPIYDRCSALTTIDCHRTDTFLTTGTLLCQLHQQKKLYIETAFKRIIISLLRILSTCTNNQTITPPPPSPFRFSIFKAGIMATRSVCHYEDLRAITLQLNI